MLYIKRIDDNADRREVQHKAGIELLCQGVMQEYGICVCEDDISRTELGKPYFLEYPNIFFSISHCDGLAVCLISGCNCGADAEKIRPARDNVARRIFSEREASVYAGKQGSDKDFYFTSLWTLKEAYSKADGRGISVMKNADFCGENGINDHVNGYCFRQFSDGEYIISLCAEGGCDGCDCEIAGEDHAGFDRIL